MKQSKKAGGVQEKKRSSEWLYRYFSVAVIFGVTQGVVTYYFLNDLCCTALISGIFNNPFPFAPYLFIMAVIAFVGLYLMANHNVLNVAIFMTFIAAWLLVGFGSYFLFTQICYCI